MGEEDGETGLEDAILKRDEAETKSGGKATSFWGLKALPSWPLSHRHKLCESEKSENGSMEKKTESAPSKLVK